MVQFYSVYDLLPAGDSVDVNAILAAVPGAVPEGVQVQKDETAVEPFVFGMMKVHATFIIDDIEGIGEKLENALRAIPGVDNIECVSTTSIRSETHHVPSPSGARTFSPSAASGTWRNACPHDPQ